jgi:hypothetical protein
MLLPVCDSAARARPDQPENHTPRSDALRTVTTRRVGPLRWWRRSATGSPAAVSVAVCDFTAHLRFFRSMGGILNSPSRYTHEALGFLLILGKSFFPKLHICALHARDFPALAKCPEQLGIFSEPRMDEFGPFLAESLQSCAQLRILLDELYEVKKRHEITKLAGIVVARLLVRHSSGLCCPWKKASAF